MEYLDLAFALKLATTALVVLLATLAAERAGPFVGALIVALPISAGPAYVIVAMEHDAAFVAASAHASLTLNAAMGPFVVAAAAANRYRRRERRGWIPRDARRGLAWLPPRPAG